MSENLISSKILGSSLKYSRFLRVAMIFILIHFGSFSQTHSISTSVGITRFDIFHSIAYSLDTNRCSFSAGLAYGINRTVFQQKIFPRVSAGFHYSALKKNRFELGPEISYSFSFLKYTSSSKPTMWNELNTGLFWSFGNRVKVGQSVLVGYVGQSHFSTIQQKRTTGSTWGYYVDLKLSYAF